MRESLSVACSHFIKSRDAIKGTFPWDNSYMYPICAAMWADKGQVADVSGMRRCRDILKNQTGVFSEFRGNGKLALITKLAIAEVPEEKMKTSMQVYDILKEHFWASPYLPLAAMIVAELAEPWRYKELAARTKHIYDLMKSEHPFLTSSEDSVFATLLAFSDMTDSQVVEEMERCYQTLKPNFFSANAVQSLSHVLALGEGSAEQKCRKTMELFNALKARGRKYGTDYELATLGVLALIPVDTAVLVEDMIEVDDFLSRMSGYGFFGCTKRQRLMHAAMIVSGAYLDENGKETMGMTAISSTIAMIAAQQAAMCAAIAAAAAANSSSN